MLMCTTTLERMSFRDFLVLIICSDDARSIVDSCMEQASAHEVMSVGFLEFAYAHRLHIPGLADVEVPV